MSFMQQTNAVITAICDKEDHIEHKMGEFAKAHNELVDIHNDMDNDLQNIKLKMADLQDFAETILPYIL